MTLSLKVYADDLTTLIGTLDQPYRIGWLKDLLDVGSGMFTIPHDSPVVQANPSILDAENLVKVDLDGSDIGAWIVRSRKRTRGEVWDPIEVSGPDVLELLSQALVYPPNGLAGQLQDQRLFAWQTIDYDPDGDWTVPTSLGTYADPTDAALDGDTTVTTTDEVQRVALNAEEPPYPWGSDYPSPGGLPGTFTLSHRSQTTSALQWDASTGDIEAALEALPHVDGVTVSGATTSTFDVAFDGSDVAGQLQELLKLNHSQLRHGTSGVTRVTAGSKQVDSEELVDGWPDQSAEWFGNFGTLSHYRRVLDVAARGHAGPARLYVTSLGEFDVWFDGDWLGSGDNLDLRQFSIELYDVDHAIAIRAEAPVIATIVRVDDAGEPTSVLYRTAAAATQGPWQVYETDEPPGVTPGFLLKTLFDEASDRGYLPPVTIDFDDTTDSLGNAWTKDVELGVQVGDDSVLSAAERLRDLDVFLEMTPGLVFRVWEDVKEDRGATPDTATVTVPVDGVFDLDLASEDEEFTALLLRTVDRWIEKHIAGVRREGFVSLGTVTTDRGAGTISGALLDRLQLSRRQCGWQSYSSQTTPQPGDYDLGDVIVAPVLSSITDSSWSTADVRVDLIAGHVDDNGDVLWRVEGEPL